MKKFLALLFCASLLLTALAHAHIPSEKKPLVVILLGPPGAGKGTHAGPLGRTLDIPHISTGDLFRENLRNETALGKKVKSFMEEGKLVPDSLVVDMLFDRIAREDCKKGYILDGFPRTLAQAQALDKHLNAKTAMIALHLQVPDKVLVERITGRLMCKDCGAPFHKTFLPPKKEGKCDHCNGILYQRKDDTEKVVFDRLTVYHKETKPLISYYGKRDSILHNVDCLKDKEQISKELIETVRQF